ncbi:hypothetical protein [Streptomyces sp. CB00455]|uniref:hypothetical protein n=1 Tax=Streptomyces sp. CB00455 TaxID=1703927 RepID=UPI00093B49EC|nr:hypothetical protein [Streptomyces sp. CB00455]
MPRSTWGRTRRPGTWLRTPEDIARPAARTPEDIARPAARSQDAATRRRAVPGHLQQTGQPATAAVRPTAQQQHHTARPDQGTGPGRAR